MNKAESNIITIKERIEQLPDVTIRPMFGYQCYSVGGKFFAGIGKKNKLIIRLSKDQQLQALDQKQLKIRPFSHGAKMGWVELDGSEVSNLDAALVWIKRGYDNALDLQSSKK
jgi:TfoX/Sxy family transcriptional regulator of competence genes